MAFLKGSMQRTDSGNTGTKPTPEGTAPSPALAAARFRFSHIAALDGFRGCWSVYAPQAGIAQACLTSTKGYDTDDGIGRFGNAQHHPSTPNA